MADLSSRLGITLDPWQETVLQAAMGERSDGTWASKQIGLSVPRQNGKSQLIVARALAGALLFGETKIVISAHQQDTARETFSKFLEMRDASTYLTERIPEKGIMRALNRESLRFANGALIQFKARSVSGGRGFSADCLFLDEAQILGMPAWVSINSTMSARPNPQVWLMGTPPTPEDNGEVFTSLRQAAKGGKSRTLAWLEWAAKRDQDPALDSTRAGANPAWWARINHEIVQGEFETYPPDRFALDRLGIWREDQMAADPAIPPDTWSARRIEVEAAPTVPPESFALSMSPERIVSIAWAAGNHVELALDDERVDDTDRLVEWFVERCGRRLVVMIDSRDPAASLVGELRRKRVKVNVTTQQDSGRACGLLYDEVTQGRLTHIGQAQIDDLIAVAEKSPVGKSGAWEWDPSDGSLSPLRALTLARFGISLRSPKRERSGRVITV